MSEIILLVLLLVGLVLFVAISKWTNRKNKRKAHNQLSAYVSEITNQLRFKQSFWRRLLHQVIIIDDEQREMLVVNFQDKHFTHKLFSLDMIESIKVVTLQETISFDYQSKNTDSVITQVGVEIGFIKPRQEIFLVLYDHIAHNMLQMPERKKEALQLQADINKMRAPQPIKAELHWSL
jgi:type II secretory pathway pseudopilin PulG